LTKVGVFLVLFGFLAPAEGAEARELPVRRRSPRAEARLDLLGASVVVDYGRPALKGRPGFGGLAPWNEVWRFGDDESTRLVTDVPLTLGNLTLAPGSYALFLLPVEPGRFSLIVNRAVGRWGAFNYDPSQDVGRVSLRASPLERPLEQLSLAWEPTEERRGRLWIGWEGWVLGTDFSAGEAAPLAQAPPVAALPERQISER
jgi:hypothetical protein